MKSRGRPFGIIMSAEEYFEELRSALFHSSVSSCTPEFLPLENDHADRDKQNEQSRLRSVFSAVPDSIYRILHGKQPGKRNIADRKPIETLENIPGYVKTDPIPYGIGQIIGKGQRKGNQHQDGKAEYRRIAVGNMHDGEQPHSCGITGPSRTLPPRFFVHNSR